MNDSQNVTGSALTPKLLRVPARNSELSFVLNFLILMISSLVLTGGFLHAAATVANLNAEITTLQSTTTKTINDVNAAFLDLQTRTNMTQCALGIGGVLTGKNGTTINWPISFVPGTFSVTSVQFDIPIQSSFTIVSVSTGAASLAAGKSILTNVVSDSERVLIFGVNQTVIGSGVIAVAQVKIASGTTARQYPFSLINPVASNTAGSTVPFCLTSGLVGVQ